MHVYNNSNQTIFVCGHFSYYEATNDMEVGTIMPANFFDDNDKLEAPFYFGKSNVYLILVIMYNRIHEMNLY